jgi:hypothetical protein
MGDAVRAMPVSRSAPATMAEARIHAAGGGG